MGLATRTIRPAVWLALCMAAALLCVAPRPAYACTPPPGGLPVYTPAERALSAEIVLVGTVTAVSDGPSTIPGSTATIAVERYLKGAGAETLIVSGYGPSSLCRSQVEAGQRWIFYIVGDAEQGYRAFYKSQFDAVDVPTPEAIAQIEAALGGTGARIFLPLLFVAAGPVDEPQPPAAPGPALAAALALFGALGVVVVARRRT